jgi:hypothetical protein
MTDASIFLLRSFDTRRRTLAKIRGLTCTTLLLIGSPACAKSPVPVPAHDAAEVTLIDSTPNALPLTEPDHAKLPSRLVWSDEFDGAKLDTNKWPRNGIFRFPGYPAETTLAAQSGETERYDPSEVVFGGGSLHLRCEPDIGPDHIAWGKSLLPHVGKPPYSGEGLPRLFGVTDKCGLIHTYPNYVSPPGSMLVMRVKLPTDCKGRWPAAWMFGYPYPGSPNPNAGIPFAGQENDIFEANGKGQLKITMHNELKPAPHVTISYSAGWLVVRQWRDRANNRVYEWFNDKLVAVLPAGNVNDLAMPLMLNLAGGTPNWSFIGLPDETTPRMCEMQVDYVRIYQ